MTAADRDELEAEAKVQAVLDEWGAFDDTEPSDSRLSLPDPKENR